MAERKQQAKRKSGRPPGGARDRVTSDGQGSGDKKGIDEQEVRDVEEMSTPRTPVIYEVVRRIGEEEMKRPNTSLWWSGVAAGVSMSFSLLAQAALEARLPVTAWKPLVASLGYTVGFLMVVLGRQQLFTESTITVVLPVLKDFNSKNVYNLARLWTIVLVANLVGTLFAAVFWRFTPAMPSEFYAAALKTSALLTQLTWWETLIRGMGAGFLIASMVWMLPTAESSKFAVIALITYLISISGFTHIVAGSMEAYVLVLFGQWAWWQAIVNFIIPTLIGNIVGGTALFAAISYAQVMKEI
jgi:formate/nitrite transporter FocA (FNT family)